MTAGEWWKKPQRKCVDQPINWCKGNSALSWKRKETFFPLISASAMQFRYQSSFFFDSINWFREFYSTWEQSCEIFICYLVGWAKDSTLYFTKNSIIAFQIIHLKVLLKKNRIDIPTLFQILAFLYDQSFLVHFYGGPYLILQSNFFVAMLPKMPECNVL